MAVLIIVIVTKMIQKMLLIKEIEILLSELFGRIFDTGTVTSHRKIEL